MTSPRAAVRLPFRIAIMTMAMAAAHAATLSPTPKEYLVPRATITVDADLGEWQIKKRGYRVDPTQAGKDPAISLHQNDAGNPFKGATDLSARVALAWDDTYLYIAGIVRDDDLNGVPVVAEHNIGPAGWKCDSVMFRVHSFRQPLKSNSPHTRTPFLALRYEVKDGGRGRLVSNRNRVLELPTPYWKLPKGSKLATRETPDGYIVEAAAPWSALAFKPQPGEVLFGSFLLADIDAGEKLNQLGWHFDGEPRQMAILRLVDRTDATALLSLASDTVRPGAKWSVGYRVDARAADVRIERLAIVGKAGQAASFPIAVAAPRGQTATGRVVVGAVKLKPGAYAARLVASINGQSVALASERFQITAAPPPAPIIRNPAGELHRQRPDRVPHHAQDDFRRKIVRHGFVAGKAGYERYILTHVKDYVDSQMEPALKRNDRYIGSKAIMAFVLYKLTGEQRYADWTRRGIEVMLANQQKKTDWRQLFGMTQARYYVWQHDLATRLAPPGAEDEFKRLWARAASEYDEGWMFGEWGYHNRCWHRAIQLKIAAYFADQTGAPVKPRVREYIAWHDPLLARFGATTDNSSGYHWVGFRYPVYWHMATDTLDELGRHPGWLAALHRWRRYASPSGAVPNFGDTSGWGAGAPQAMANYELMGRLTKDGRFRWTAHRIAEYLYNHFWPRHDQYHLPREFVAMGFCQAWLHADDSVAPRPPKPASAVTLRTRCVQPTEEDKANRPGLSGLKLTDELVPDKLVLSSGNDPNGLWGLVELVSLAGHCGRLPGHIVTLVQHDAALLINPAYNEESCDLNNILWVEDMEGLAADPRPMRTEVPRFVEDPAVTYARIRAKPYQQMPITYERDIVFVKNAFVLVRDRVEFHATMKVRVGPCWQTRDLGPQSGKEWYNTYIEWIYFTGLGLGRGVHAYRNPAWDLLVRFAPRPDTKFTVTSRYDDNPWRPCPTTLRQSWTGIVQPGDVKTFTTVLLPHAPAHDVRPFADWVEFLADDGRTTLVRVRTEFDVSHHRQQEHWLLLQDEPKRVQVEGFSSDAALALATFDFGVNRKLALGAKAPGNGRVRNVVLVGGTGLTANGQDLLAKARKPKIKSAYTVEP